MSTATDDSVDLVDQVDDDENNTDDDENNTDDAGRASAPAGQRGAARQRSAPAPGRQVGGARVGARFRSLGHFLIAAASGEVVGDELARYQRALATTTSGAQTGLVHETWIREIVDLQSAVSPTVELFSSRPLPADGNTIEQPKVTTRAAAGKQTTENTEIASQAVVITPVSFTIETFAGGQGMSLQTVKRSSPEYLNEVRRLEIEALALEINEAACDAVVAAIPDGTPAPDQIVEMTGTFNTAVNACVAGMYATLRKFPSFILLATDLWQDLADLEDTDGRPIYPSLSAFNQMGTLDLTSDRGQHRTLHWRIEPELPTGSAVVAHQDAFRTFSGPIETISADVPSTLSRDHAVYQFVAMGATDTRGLWMIVPDEGG